MKNISQALRALVFFTILTGLIYPLGMTILGKFIFPKMAGGSLVEKNGKIIGSTLISQKFSNGNYFWPRPSASDFSANPSAASNLGPTSQDLKKQIGERRETLAKTFEVDGAGVPQDLITTSGSGVDPHISSGAAKIQVARVVRSRKWPQEQIDNVNHLIDSLTEGPTLGTFGDTRVNVLKLNMALDEQDIGVK